MTHRHAERATIQERGNGLAEVGDFVAGDDGEVYVVVELTGRIMVSSGSTQQDALVTLADWDDVNDDNEPVCSATISDEAHVASLAPRASGVTP